MATRSENASAGSIAGSFSEPRRKVDALEPFGYLPQESGKVTCINFRLDGTGIPVYSSYPRGRIAGLQIAFAPTRGETPELRSRRSPTDADVADGPAFRSDPRSRPDQSTGYWLKNVFSTRAMSSGATTCPCPSSVCRSVWGMAAVIAFAARSKKSVGRPANWGSVVGPSVVTRTD